ncbi:trypsin-like serine protease [Oligoflexia bacterium]|nr:trypsin-like serine protease [Oligoflexia bacterium]
MKTKFFLAVMLLALFTSCTSSDDGDSGGGNVSKNACPTLGLLTRVIDGTACQELGSPVVKITLEFSDGSSGLCSGTMISSDDVLTAAHCFFSDVTNAFVEVNSKRIAAHTIVMHPDVIANEEALAVFNDVAVLQLSQATGFPTLPILGSRDIAQDDIVSIYGYGLDNSGGMGVLRSGQMKISHVTDSHLFAPFNGAGSNTCNGDSGGPAIFSFSDQEGITTNAIVGIVSSGNDVNCQVGDTTLFSNVQSTSISSFITTVVPDVTIK